MTEYKVIPSKDYNIECDGYLSFNPVMKGLFLNRFNDFEHYTKSDSIGLTSYLLEHFEIEDNAYLSDDGKWGYIHNVFFSVIGVYNNLHKYNKCWYHIRIESMI